MINKVWVDTADTFAKWMERASKEEAIALDTEFVWERTYYPQLGVIQVGFASGECILIDTVTLKDLSALGDLVAHPGIQKILHDAPQDLTILRTATGAFPKNVFDTRLAGGLVGLKGTLSLLDLARETLDIELDKGETRSNWLKRPLTESQLTYAALDVLHLHAIRDALVDRASERGRLEWVSEEMKRYEGPELYQDRDPEVQYERIKGRNKCSPQQMAVLKELATWREHEARARDLPRTFVAPDTLLLAIAKGRPANGHAIVDLAERPKSIMRFKDGLYQAYRRGMGNEPLDREERTESPAFYRTLDKEVGRLMEVLRTRCEEAGVDPTLVATRADMRSFAENADGHPLTAGWRYEIAGEALLSALGNTA